MVFTAAVLCDHYVHAESMSRETRAYYENMISSHDVEEWEKEILDAESRRLNTPSAMDILRAREMGAGVDAGADADMECLQQTAEGPGDRWIQLGLVIEEQQ